jgi:hypothetical protein
VDQRAAREEGQVRRRGLVISVYGIEMDAAEPLLDILKSGMASRWRVNDGLAGHC